MSADYRKGLDEAHRLLREMHNRLEREHRNTPSGFFGPTRRHHEIMATTRTLLALGTQVFDEIKRDYEREASSP